MKVTINKDIPDLTPEEMESIKESADTIPDVGDHPEEFKRQMVGVQEVVLSPQVAKQLEEMGMTPDDLVAMLLNKSGMSN